MALSESDENKTESETYYLDVDERGRSTLPKEIRDSLGLESEGVICAKLVNDRLLMMVPDDPFDKLVLNAEKEAANNQDHVVLKPGESPDQARF